MTAQDIIYVALRLIGVSRAGQGANPETLADSLSALNGMMDSWSAESLMRPVQARSVFNYVAAQQQYTVGSGGDWNIARPAEVSTLNIVINANGLPVEYPTQMFSDQEWASVAAKTIGTPYPTSCYVNYLPTRITIDLWPAPNAGGQVALYYEAALGAFADLNSTQYTFQPGYELALKYNLAELLWPMFVGSQLKNDGASFAEIQRQAAEYKRRVAAQNAPDITMRTDAALSRGGGGRYWIYSDTNMRGTR